MKDSETMKTIEVNKAGSSCTHELVCFKYYFFSFSSIHIEETKTKTKKSKQKSKP